MRKKTTEEQIRFGLHLKAMKDQLAHGEFLP
jgi:hypothetical protein